MSSLLIAIRSVAQWRQSGPGRPGGGGGRARDPGRSAVAVSSDATFFQAQRQRRRSRGWPRRCRWRLSKPEPEEGVPHGGSMPWGRRTRRQRVRGRVGCTHGARRRRAQRWGLCCCPAAPPPGVATPESQHYARAEGARDCCRRTWRPGMDTRSYVRSPALVR